MTTRLPFVVGVAGHRDIAPESRQALIDAVTAQLVPLSKACQPAELVVYCSLADGADQVCGEVAVALGLKLMAVLPKPHAVFRSELTQPEVFDALLKKAHRIEVIESADGGYSAAADAIAERAHVMLALWDGRAIDRALPGGTSYSVSLRRGHWPYGDIASRMRKLGLLIIIPTLRTESQSREGLQAVIDPRNTKTVELALQLARDVSSVNQDLIRQDGCDPANMLPLMERADRAALSLQQRTRITQRITALFAVIAFALQQTGAIFQNTPLSLAAIVIMVLLITSLHFGRGRKTGNRYLAMRTLAEILRVERHVPMGSERSTLLTAQFNDAASWLFRCALEWSTSRPSMPADLHDWITGQAAYFERTVQRLGKHLRLMEQSSKIMYFGALAIVFIHACILPDVDSLQAIPGALMLGAALMEHHIQLRALSDHISRYSSLARLFALANTAVEGEPSIANTRVATEIAHETLAEIGTWYSIHLARPLDVIKV